MPDKIRIAVTVNGTAHDVLVEPRTLLLDFLRDELALTGAPRAASRARAAPAPAGQREPTRACLMFAAQLDGAEVTTVESLAGPDGTLHPVQRAFTENHGLQCGFCTPGHPAGRLRPAGAQPAPRAVGRPGGPVGQPLPLHRLPEHRAVGRRRGFRGMSYKYVGKPTPRKEDPKLLTGRAGYIGDVVVPGMLHAAVLRSPHAHACINSIDTSRAGVARIILRHDRRRGAGAHRADTRCCAKPVNETAIATSGYAIRASRSPWSRPRRYLAEDARGLIDVDYELLGRSSTRSARWGPTPPPCTPSVATPTSPSAAASISVRVDEDFAQADHVIRRKLRWAAVRRTTDGNCGRRGPEYNPGTGKFTICANTNLYNYSPGCSPRA